MSLFNPVTQPTATNPATAAIQMRFRHAPVGQHKHPSGLGNFALDVQASIRHDAVTAIFGRSGSGKTTLLRCIAGLIKPTQGQLHVNGQCWQDETTFVPPHQRRVGYVFQEPSLFSHLTVAGNLSYAQKRAQRTQSKAAVTAAMSYKQLIDLFDIQRLLTQYPGQLSGGERQRVAIARALLSQPQLLLMDEPLAGLDIWLKQEILPYLQQLRQRINIPLLYVSHSVSEVAQLADDMIIMDHGQISAQGSVEAVCADLSLDIWQDQAVGVVIKGQMTAVDQVWQLQRFDFAGGHLWLQGQASQANQSQQSIQVHPVQTVRILASDISLSLTQHTDSSVLNVLAVTVSQINPTDTATVLIDLYCGQTKLIAKITQKSCHDLNIAIGQCLWAQIKTAAIL